MKIGNRPIRNTTREEVMNNRFGTTSDMIIQTVQEKEGCACLAFDVAARLNALSLDADSLLEQNRHRIPKITGESKKKVNPLKASKRSMKG